MGVNSDVVVICIYNDKYTNGSFTLGKRYTTMGVPVYMDTVYINSEFYHVTDDNGYEIYTFKKYFITPDKYREFVINNIIDES